MTKDVSNLPPEERKHFHYCEYCENYYDRRDLGEIFLHAEGDCVKTGQKHKSESPGAGKVGRSWFNNIDKINFNLN